MQEQAEGFGRRGKAPTNIRRRDLRPKGGIPCLLPAVKGSGAHPHGLHHFGFGADLFPDHFGLMGGHIGLLHRAASYGLVEECCQDQERTAAEGQKTKPRMKKRNPGEEKGRPRDIERGHKDRRGHQALNRFEITQACLGISIRRDSGFAHHSIKDATIKARLKPGTDTGHDAPASKVQKPHDPIEKSDKHRERKQSRLGTAPQNTIINLQHIERASEHEEIGKEAKDANGPIETTAFAPGGSQFVQTFWVCCLLHNYDTALQIPKYMRCCPILSPIGHI